ncbi:MAG TPA: stage II sporulation protein M [Rugosimonospora sp.]|nr:stage II sporulation protein M [Rugosimonospora sp.]
MDLDAYVTEHGAEWNRLDRLSRRHRLSAAEVDEMIVLYQRAGTHLSAIRSRAPEPALIARLSRIVLTARASLTAGPSFSWRAVARFFTVTFPLAVFQAWRWWCAVATVFTVSTFALMWWVASDPAVQLRFLSQDEIDGLVGGGFADYYSENQPQNFALAVWTHNALLTAAVLASGVLVVPVFYLLYENALNVGVVGGVMIGNGRSAEFFGLIMPHGMLELTVVYIGAGLGLRIAWAWIAPGPLLTRGRSLARAARSAMLGALGLALALGVSGLLEAFVTPSALPPGPRVAIGLLVWAAFLGYVLVAGGLAAQRAESADLSELDSEALVPVA